VTPDGKKLYVACSRDDPGNATGTVRVYKVGATNPDTIIAGFPRQTPPTLVVVDADQRYVYVATSATAPASGRVHVVDAATDKLLPQLFMPGGTSSGLATSPKGTAYDPCLLAVSAEAGIVTLGDPAPLRLAQPRPPRVATTIGLGSGAGEHLAWSTVPFSRGRVELDSLVRPAVTARGIAPGAALVRAMYIRGDHLRPYQFEVRLNPTLEAQANLKIRKDQYDLLMNIVNWFHPLGVEVVTRALRSRVVELEQAGAELFPGYTYPVYHNRGPVLPQPITSTSEV
jgi:hypothetical protein